MPRTAKVAIAHVLSLAVLVPFLWMRWLHQRLGLTDAFLGGDQRSADFNLVMVFFFCLGAVAFLAGYKPNGGAYQNPRGRLRAKGLIDYPVPDMLSLTPEGAALRKAAAASHNRYAAPANRSAS